VQLPPTPRPPAHTRALGVLVRTHLLPRRYWWSIGPAEAADRAARLERRLASGGLHFIRIKDSGNPRPVPMETALGMIAGVLSEQAYAVDDRHAHDLAGTVLREMIRRFVPAPADVEAGDWIADTDSLLRELDEAESTFKRETDEADAKRRAELWLETVGKGYVRGGPTTWQDDDWREQP
jgi:hypothetical protein